MRAGTATAMGLVPSRGLGAEGGHHAWRGAGHADADHVVLQGKHGMVGGHPQVAGVTDGNHANAHFPGLANGDVHGLGCHDGAQAPIRVDAGGGGGLADDADGGLRVDFAPLVATQVTSEHI